MIQVIDIRKYDPKKVIEYWESKGAFVNTVKNWDLEELKVKYPYIGVLPETSTINAWPSLNKNHELIDLPKTNWVDEFLEGTNTDAEISGSIRIEHKGIKAFAEYDLDRVKFDVSCQKEDFQNIEQIVKIIAEKFNLKC
jgi:hypothetical protein